MFMINWQYDFVSSNSAYNHIRDKQIGLLLLGRPILLSLVWLQTELDSTQSYILALLIKVSVSVITFTSTLILPVDKNLIQWWVIVWWRSRCRRRLGLLKFP